MPDHPNQKTVLIVEDNPLNMKLAAELLELHGVRVLKASDGEAALTLLDADEPDLILTDIHLQGLDGFELFRRIRANSRLQRVRVVALTALAMREEEQKIREFGFSDYIAKPINTRSFVKKIQELLS